MDFEIETENDTDLPLKISVDLLKDKIWQSGDSISKQTKNLASRSFKN